MLLLTRTPPLQTRCENYGTPHGEKTLLPPLTRGLSWRCHDWGREKLLFSENIVSPSVFCFAKSTSLVRGRKGICCNIKGLHYSPAGSDSASAHCFRRGVHRTPALPPKNHIKILGGHRNPPLLQPYKQPQNHIHFIEFLHTLQYLT